MDWQEKNKFSFIHTGTQHTLEVLRQKDKIRYICQAELRNGTWIWGFKEVIHKIIERVDVW